MVDLTDFRPGIHFRLNMRKDYIANINERFFYLLQCWTVHIAQCFNTGVLSFTNLL